ncbi:MAG: hypothetical protein Q4G42_03780 [Neisseria sp.]|nr:hypothetical protein [Neisseria sp.]
MQKLTIKYMAVFILLFGTLNLQGCRAMLPGCSIEEWWDGECSGYLGSTEKRREAFYNSYTPEQKSVYEHNRLSCKKKTDNHDGAYYCCMKSTETPELDVSNFESYSKCVVRNGEHIWIPM